MLENINRRGVEAIFKRSKDPITHLNYEYLEVKSKSSRTTKLWVDVLTKSLFLCLLLIRGEWEEDWPLHLEAAKNMIPLFFVAGHANYES